MTVIRRKAGAKRASTVRAASVRWVVYARQGGEPREQGSYSCPHEAEAVARELRRDCRLASWVRRAS
jgi:hypothetical protein